MALTNSKYNKLPHLPNVQGFWRMEEESGTRADLSDNANTLQDINTVLFGAGKIGNAADFERNNSEYLSITDALQTGLDITGEITIAHHFKRESDSGSYETLISKWDYTGKKMSYALRISTSDKLECVLTSDGTTSTTGGAQSTDNISTGTWYHCAFTLNQTTDLIQIYIDGLANGNAVAYTSNIYDSNVAFRIGADKAGNYADGLIDEVIVWNTCLTATEILKVKNITAYQYGVGFSGFSPWIFMKDMWEEHNKIFRPKGILVPKGI